MSVAEVSFENRRAAQIASQELRDYLGADWTKKDERELAAWYQELDEEFAAEGDA